MDTETKLIFGTPSAFMHEVRLCWNTGIRRSNGCLWIAENAVNLEMLEHHMSEGCKTFGEGTYWIEHRIA